MKAMILAAGLGMRMRPLTETIPKALLPINGKPIITHLIEQLAAAEIKDIVINVSYLAEQIMQTLGDGSRFGVKITYSKEDKPLETGGGIRKALPILGEKPFMFVNCDVWTDYPFEQLTTLQPPLAHLVLVPNPAHNPSGDFSLQGGMVNLREDVNTATFAGMGVYNPTLFEGIDQQAFSVTPILKAKAPEGMITGEFYHGQWRDIGSIESYQQVANG